MKETWKQVLGAPNYMISNLGRVKGPTRILKPCLANSGYLLVSMSIKQPNGRRKVETRYIHRLIAEAFVPNDRPDRTYVNHKDKNKLNNTIENLEWVTNSENIIHAWTTMFSKEDIKKCFLHLPKETQVELLEFFKTVI